MRALLILIVWLGLAPAVLAPAALAQGISTPASSAGGPQRTERIEAELVSMSAWATPGSTVVVAIRQDIEPGWHTYWRNPGDSGGATTLDWRLPEGVSAGSILWPLPERQPYLGMVNYGYSGEVFLPVPIDIPASVRAGQTLNLQVTAHFLVCSAEMCVPDDLELALALPVRDGQPGLSPTHGAAIQNIVEGAPRPGGFQARAGLVDGQLTISVAGDGLGAERLGPVYFFPNEGGIIDHAATQAVERGPDGVTITVPAGRALATNGLTGPVAGLLSTAAGSWEITAEPGAMLANTSGEAVGDGAGVDWAAAGQAALFALLGGLILNLMPCVFPILAMKAASLAKGAHDRKTARRDGLAYTAGILVTFLALAGLLLGLRAAGEAVGWGFQLQSPAVIGVLALLMLAVGLNLSNVYQVGISTDGRLSRLPGWLGAFFTGVLAVVVAAPCTAPFMAAALGAALFMPAPLALMVFALLGLGLALPYLLVSLMPGVLDRMPKPGPWMERLKGLLAFPMYGAALWLVWVFSAQTGPEALALLLAAGLALAAALWLFGTSQADRANGGRGGVSLIAAAVLVLGAVFLAVMAARIPPAPTASQGSTGALVSQPWSPTAVAAARAEGRPVLVNFTADWCVSCKVNERIAFASPKVAEAMQAANAVYLVGDWTRRDDAITAELERHKRSGVPLYLLYSPGSDEPRILPQLLTEGLVVEAIRSARGLEETTP